MKTNKQYAPYTIPIEAYDTVYDPPLRGVDVLADGVLVVEDVAGNVVAYNLTNVLPVFRLQLQIRRIIGDGNGQPLFNGDNLLNLPYVNRGIEKICTTEFNEESQVDETTCSSFDMTTDLPLNSVIALR